MTKTTLSIYQGDDYAAVVTVYQSDGITPADLTGYTAQAQVKNCFSDPAPIPFQTSISGNLITLTLSHDQTQELTGPSYVWDMQVIDSNDWITTLLAGNVTVTREVTQASA